MDFTCQGKETSVAELLPLLSNKIEMIDLAGTCHADVSDSNSVYMSMEISMLFIGLSPWRVQWVFHVKARRYWQRS